MEDCPFDINTQPVQMLPRSLLLVPGCGFDAVSFLKLVDHPQAPLVYSTPKNETEKAVVAFHCFLVVQLCAFSLSRKQLILLV